MSLPVAEVRPAPLVHIPASLFAAIDHILDLALIDAAVLHHIQQSQYAAGLRDQVLMHHVGGEVHVHIVGPLHIAHQLALEIQALRVLLIDKVLDLRQIQAIVDPRNDIFRYHRVCNEPGLYILHKPLLQVQQVEYVAHLHEHVEFILRHDLAELAVTGARR